MLAANALCTAALKNPRFSILNVSSSPELLNNGSCQEGQASNDKNTLVLTCSFSSRHVCASKPIQGFLKCRKTRMLFLKLHVIVSMLRLDVVSSVQILDHKVFFSHFYALYRGGK